MKFTLHCLLLFSALPLSALRAESPASVIRTFYVSGVECGACVYLVQLSASECKGVLKAEVGQAAEGIAQITFDPRIVTEHQIAQAIRDTMSLHGAPYLVRLRVRVGEYAKHAEAVEALFQKWRDLVRCEVLDRNKGDLLVHFLPLESGAAKNGKSGWSGVQFLQALQAGLPPEVVLQFLEENQ
jgi:copper chaperone CopZ